MEIESLGGMAKAVESGVPKMRIEEAAAQGPGKDRFRSSDNCWDK